jgi:hypothetical protein
MNSNIFNLEYWPIIYVKNNNATLTDEILEEYQKDFLKILIRCKTNKEKIVLLIDIYNKSNVQMNYMSKISQFHQRTEEYNKKYIDHIYILCESKFLKTMISMFLTNENPVAPCKVIRSLSKLRHAFHHNHSKDIKDLEVYKKLQEFMSENNE